MDKSSIQENDTGSTMTYVLICLMQLYLNELVLFKKLMWIKGLFMA